MILLMGITYNISKWFRLKLEIIFSLELYYFGRLSFKN